MTVSLAYQSRNKYGYGIPTGVWYTHRYVIAGRLARLHGTLDTEPLLYCVTNSLIIIVCFNSLVLLFLVTSTPYYLSQQNNHT